MNCSGKPPGNTTAVGAGGQRVAQRVELDDVGAGGAQQLRVLGVAEAERLAGRQGDGRAARPVGSPTAVAGSHGVGGDAAARRRRPRRPGRRGGRPRRSSRRPRLGARRPYSTAVTRPRCLVGNSNSATRGMAPSTGTPACSHACRSTCSCRGEPTRLRITPAIRVAVSNVEKPCSSAAMLWLWPRASTTRTTGAPSRPATWAVDPRAAPVAARRRCGRRTGPSRPRPRRCRHRRLPCGVQRADELAPRPAPGRGCGRAGPAARPW